MAGGSGSASGRAPARNNEERAASKEQMMAGLRDNSQQDRRVYVGNLSYDVKWHHLKDFMRQGRRTLQAVGQRHADAQRLTGCVSGRVAGEVLFADVLLLPNGMSKVG